MATRQIRVVNTEFDAAWKRYTQFHSFVPNEIEDIGFMLEAFKSSNGLCVVGRAVNVVYRSNKWEKDRQWYDYVHDFETPVHVIQEYDACAEKYEQEIEIPDKLTFLGFCVGFEIQDMTTGERMTAQLEPHKEFKLACSPDGDMLVIFSKAGEFAFFVGEDLRITERGIEG